LKSIDHRTINMNFYWIVARFGKEHVEPYVYEMEEAGRFKPELMQAIFDQGVSDCL
jgi:hypothetical protein